MLKKNEEYIVDIIDNGFQGEGIAKIDGITVFIDQAIKGEKIKIKILKVQTNFAYGKIIEILEKSNNRIGEDCITYKRCGGCNLRHIKYQETLNIKKTVVENCMYKALKREVKVNDVIGMKNPLYYRNKLQYPVGIDKEQKQIMGVYSSRTHNIIPTEECFIQNKECQIIANDIFKYVQENNISAYNEETLKGTLRHIIIRIGVKTNEVLVTLVLNDNNLKKEKELIKYLTEKHKNIKSIVKNFNTKNTNVILGDKTEVIYGDGYICDILGDYKFKISPLSFYQVNPIQTEILYKTAIQFVGADDSVRPKNDIALDLYCGIGTIGIFASKYFKKVYGIEIVEQAIEDAKYNAQINNIDNIKFFAGDVEKILPEIIKRDNLKPSVVFVDPPRKGLDKKTIELLKELQPSKIIYISCNPATLARDVELLEEKYELKNVQPVDMFPFTRTRGSCVNIRKFKKLRGKYMDFQIEKVNKEKSEILKNLLEYYQYDFNVYYNEDLNENGRFEFIDIELYFENEHNQALFIKVKEKYAGFILISNNTKYTKEAKCIEEFWIMPKYRKGMFTFKILKKVFNQINGRLEFIVLKRNERWLKTLNYWIEKNYKILRKYDIEKWDEQFTLFVIDTKNKYQ